MVAALAKFVQGALTPPAGQALLGIAGTAVVVSNGDNTGVQSWTFELVDVPPGSAVTPLVQGPSGLATFTFTPDIAGSYRVRLTVQDAGGNSDQDIRVFAVPDFDVDWVAPPYQGNPLPLPLTGPGAKPEEMNFGGQLRGWAGGLTDKLLHRLIRFGLTTVWKTFTPAFNNSAADASINLGNGTIKGSYRYVRKDTIEVQILIIVGSTTNFGAGTAILLDIPPGLSVDYTKLLLGGATLYLWNCVACSTNLAAATDSAAFFAEGSPTFGTGSTLGKPFNTWISAHRASFVAGDHIIARVTVPVTGAT